MSKFVDEATCHRLEIEPRNSGVRVKDSRGLTYLGAVKLHIDDKKIDMRRHEYVCDKCSKRLGFDEARVIL